MPPKRTKKVSSTPAAAMRVTAGAGVTAGLELWQIGSIRALWDATSDNRFAADVTAWNTAAGLNAATLQTLKDAANATSLR